MGKSLRVALVRPSVDVLYKFSKPVEALGIAYIAAALRLDGHDVVILDAMLYDWTVEETLARIEAVRADLIGFTIVLNHFPARLIELLERMQEVGTPGVVLVGGHAVSFFPERVLQLVPRVDGVLSGEGEKAIRVIARVLADGGPWHSVPGLTTRGEDGSVKNLPPERLHDLSSLPWPARDMTQEVIRLDGVAAISTSRGCYARCAFCSVPRFYGLDQNKRFASGSWFCRDAEDVVAEIEYLRNRLDVRELLFVDDEFFGGSEAGFERAMHLGRLLAERDLGISFAISCRAENVQEDVLLELRKAGLSHVFVGVEAGTGDSLRFYGKGHTIEQNRAASRAIKALGLSFQAGFMLFNPRVTLEDLHENLQFLKDIGEFKPMVINSAVDPHFGAPLLQSFRRDGVLRDEGLRLSVEYSDVRVRAAKAVAELCAEAFQPFMSFIAAVRSSVTYEWRRPVPGREEPEERLLDAFERRVNDAFACVMERAVRSFLKGDEPRVVIQSSAAEVAHEVEIARLGQALVITHLESVEGGVHYWSSHCQAIRSED